MTNHIRFSLLTLTIAFSTVLHAQQNALRITPLQPILGKMSLEYERSIAPRTTVLVEYQKWFERRQNGIGFFFWNALASSNETNTNKGYRMNVLLRKYSKETFRGGFVEGGFYIGKHDIVTRTETSTLTFDGDFFFLPIYDTKVEETKYDNVRVAGLKFGGGLQKTIGDLSLECSAGLNINGFNDQNIRPTLGMKPVSPYGRIAVGVVF